MATRPVCVAPVKNPPPAFCCCNTTPVKEIGLDLPPAGLGAVPLNKPLEVVMVTFTAAFVLVTLLAELSVMPLVKLFGRFPLASQCGGRKIQHRHALGEHIDRTCRVGHVRESGRIKFAGARFLKPIRGSIDEAVAESQPAQDRALARNRAARKTPIGRCSTSSLSARSWCHRPARR